MAFADRPYADPNYRPPGRAGGGFYARSGGGRGGAGVIGRMRSWSVNSWLIAINIVIHLTDMVLMMSGRSPLFWVIGFFSADTAVLGGQVWRFITFQFLHSHFTIWHIVMNMIGLFFFGPVIERYLGSRRYLVFYLLCGMAGPVAFLLLWAGNLLSVSAAVPLVGASAGVFGVLIAAARIAPETTVYLYGIFPVKLRHLAWLLIFIAAYTVVFFGHSGQHNAGGEAAHLGGAALGFLLIQRPQLLNWANRKWRRSGRASASSKRDKRLDYEVDRILKKVHDQGLASLTQAEKDTLAKARHR